MLILDEPTNHLDVDSREALIHALAEYQGAVILISHDRHLIEASADRLWIVKGGTVSNYDGDMESYREELLASRTIMKQRNGAANDADAKGGRADTRRQAAERRSELAPLKKVMQSAEKQVENLASQLAKLDATLADPKLYEDASRSQKLALERGQIAKRLAEAEDLWLEATHVYEEAAAA